MLAVTGNCRQRRYVYLDDANYTNRLHNITNTIVKPLAIKQTLYTSDGLNTFFHTKITAMF